MVSPTDGSQSKIYDDSGKFVARVDLKNQRLVFGQEENAVFIDLPLKITHEGRERTDSTEATRCAPRTEPSKGNPQIKVSLTYSELAKHCSKTKTERDLKLTEQKLTGLGKIGALKAVKEHLLSQAKNQSPAAEAPRPPLQHQKAAGLASSGFPVLDTMINIFKDSLHGFKHATKQLQETLDENKRVTIERADVTKNLTSLQQSLGTLRDTLKFDMAIGQSIKKGGTEDLKNTLTDLYKSLTNGKTPPKKLSDLHKALLTQLDALAKDPKSYQKKFT